MRSRVPSVPHAASARMPSIQEARGPQMMLGLEFSSSQAANGIQFPPSPTPESVPDKFLSSFAITIQVYIFKKAEGHGAVCKRHHTPFLPGTTLSHGLRRAGNSGVAAHAWDRLPALRGHGEAGLSRGGGAVIVLLHLPLGIASQFRTREMERILLKDP